MAPFPLGQVLSQVKLGLSLHGKIDFDFNYNKNV